MAGIRLEFAQFGDFDSFSVYRSNTPMDTGNLPAPIATNLRTMYFIDGTALKENRYYYRVAAIKGSTFMLSDELLSPNNTAPPVDPVYPPGSIPTDYILAYDFNNSLIDKSANKLNGIKVGPSNFVTGRKTGTKALNLATGLIKTPKVLPVNSSKLTMSFWIKTSQIDASVLAVMDAESNYNILFLNTQSPRGYEYIEYTSSNSPTSLVTAGGFTSGLWTHVIIESVRSGLGEKDYPKMYENGVIKTQRTAGSSMDKLNFGNNFLYLGGHFSGALYYVGLLQDVRIYNRTLTANERSALFNE